MKWFRTTKAQAVFFIFLMMLAAAVLSGVAMAVLVVFDLLPDVPYPALVWSIVALVVAIMLGTAFSAFLTHWVLAPINNLIRATRAVAKGDFSVRVEEAAGKNELVDLIKSFNMMAEELGGIELFRRDFINSFSHEFKTPIASIRGFARQLQKGNITDEQRLEYTSIIISESERLTRMSSNILNLTRFENQQIIADPENFPLDEQLRSCILLLEKEWMKKNISFDLDLSPVTYNSNAEMLSQVWLNIIGNAIKFSREGGTIRVACMKNASGGASVEIEDHGIGMTNDTKSHIFEQFYQGASSRSTEGNGLGLTITARIIKLAHGEINVESTPGQGTLFIVTLP